MSTQPSPPRSPEFHLVAYTLVPVPLTCTLVVQPQDGEAMQTTESVFARLAEWVTQEIARRRQQDASQATTDGVAGRMFDQLWLRLQDDDQLWKMSQSHSTEWPARQTSAGEYTPRATQETIRMSTHSSLDQIMRFTVLCHQVAKDQQSEDNNVLRLRYVVAAEQQATHDPHPPTTTFYLIAHRLQPQPELLVPLRLERDQVPMYTQKDVYGSLSDWFNDVNPHYSRRTCVKGERCKFANHPVVIELIRRMQWDDHREEVRRGPYTSDRLHQGLYQPRALQSTVEGSTWKIKQAGLDENSLDLTLIANLYIPSASVAGTLVQNVAVL